jgi:hypothetical protein
MVLYMKEGVIVAFGHCRLLGDFPFIFPFSCFPLVAF